MYSLSKPLTRASNAEPVATIDTFEDDATGETLAARLREAEALRTLFEGCFFFLGREVPKEPLAFVIRSAGGSVSWDGCPEQAYNEQSVVVTHVIMDRPLAKIDVTK